MKTTFKTLDRYPGYRFGSDGSIWTQLVRRGSMAYRPVGEWKQMKLPTNSSGYRVVSLQVAAGLQRSLAVHRLIAEAFHGPCPDGLECCHRDGVRANCAASNLRWGTRASNHADKHLHGTASIGERSVSSKLSNAQRDEIASRYAAGGITQTELAYEYHVSQATIYNVIRRPVHAKARP